MSGTAEMSISKSRGFHPDVFDNLLHVVFQKNVSLSKLFKRLFFCCVSQNSIISKCCNRPIAGVFCVLLQS